MYLHLLQFHHSNCLKQFKIWNSQCLLVWIEWNEKQPHNLAVKCSRGLDAFEFCFTDWKSKASSTYVNFLVCYQQPLSSFVSWHWTSSFM